MKNCEVLESSSHTTNLSASLPHRRVSSELNKEGMERELTSNLIVRHPNETSPRELESLMGFIFEGFCFTKKGENLISLY